VYAQDRSLPYQCLAKIIFASDVLQLPLSAVNRTPLPFLNRLEKYTLSLHVTLEERLAALGPSQTVASLQHARPRRMCDDAELWREVRTGVEDFANAVVAQVALPGFVPRETIAALVLRAMDDSDKLGSVVVRPAVHAAANLSSPQPRSVSAADVGAGAGSPPPPPEPEDDDDDGNAAVDTDSDSSDDDIQSALEAEIAAENLAARPAEFKLPRQRLRAIIRLINFQLLQLARPESVCKGSGSGRRNQQQQLGLPEAYLREYVQRQDHFSAANLMRAQVAAHWLRAPTGSNLAASLDLSSSAKLVIFTRTGTGVARLGMGNDALLQLVQAGATDAANKPGGAGNTANAAFRCSPSAVCTLQLRSINSSEDVVACLKSFISCEQRQPRERVLLILADMSVVTAKQVNFARQQVDTAISRAIKAFGAAFRAPLVFVLAHCPPEIMRNEFPYHAVPVGGWEFMFCDAVSLGDASAGNAAASTVSTDPRRWVAAAFGLIRSPSSSDSRAEFADLFDDALKKVGVEA
jgi:hypothetical protein